MNALHQRENSPTIRVGATRRALLALGAALGLGGASTGRGQDAASATRPLPHAVDVSRTYQGDATMTEPTITHLNPEGMHANPAFSQAVTVEGARKTIYVGGQNAVDANGQIVGSGDLAAQTEQIFDNLETVLAASGATLHDIVKWTIFVVQGQDLMPGLEVFQQKWGASARPPAISMAFVAGLANPEFLVEMEAIAVIAIEPSAG